jgi:hypothetical protein
MTLRTFAMLMSLLIGILAGASTRLASQTAEVGATEAVPVASIEQPDAEPAPPVSALPPVRVVLPSPYEDRSN